MRLVYLSDAAIPSRATNAMQVMRMCAAFQRAGASVTLVRPSYFDGHLEGYRGNVWGFYGIEPTFKMRTLPAPSTPGLVNSARLWRAARAVPLAGYLSWECRPTSDPFVCYTRSFLAAWFAVQARRRWRGKGGCRSVVLELHDAPSDARTWRLLDAVDGIVTISDALRAHVLSRQPGLASKTWVEHDGVDLGSALPDLDAAEARRRLGLSLGDGRVLTYTGRVNSGKGADVVLAAADELGTLGIHVLIVGRIYEESSLLPAGRPSNVTLTGFVPPSDVPLYTAAADYLVMPTTPRLAYAAYTSPLKLFEYMASGRPIVASDLPTVREVLEPGVNAVLYEAESTAGLVEAIRTLHANDALCVALAARARQDVAWYSWDQRAARILDQIQSGGQQNRRAA